MSTTRVGDSFYGLHVGPAPATGFCFYTGNNREGLPLRSYSEHEIVNFYAIDSTGSNVRYHDQSLLGKRVKVVRGDCEVSTPVCMGKEGVIIGWYDFAGDQTKVILPASCLHMAVVSGDNGETFHANTSWCDILS